MPNIVALHNPRGFTRMDNQMMDALMSIDLSARELKIFLYVAKATLNFNTGAHRIPAVDIAKATHIHPDTVSKAISGLLRRRVLYREGGARGDIGVCDPKEWIFVVEPKQTISSDSAQVVRIGSAAKQTKTDDSLLYTKKEPLLTLSTKEINPPQEPAEPSKPDRKAPFGMAQLLPTTVNNDLIIYNDEAQTAYLERIQDNLDVFNASSNGAIVLDNELIQGDFRKRAFYKLGGGLEHRDVNSDGKVTAKKIGAGEAVGVKAPWKYGPYQTTEEAFKRRGRAVDEFSQIIGADVADATIEGFIEYATGALKAAIGSNAAMVVSANIETDGKKTLTRGMRKFGDKFGRIALWVMHSSAYFDIVDEAIANKVYEEAGVVIYGGLPGTLGKPVLVTDKAPVDAIFGLLPNAVVITESQAPGFRSYDVNDEENLAIGYRAEGTVNIDVLGYSWKETTGGTNPTLAAVGSAANWVKHSDSNKVTAGVMINLTTTPPVGG